jgi:hypothetical protein
MSFKIKDKFYLGMLYGTALPLLSYIFGDMLQKQFEHTLRPNFFYIICIAINVIIFRFAIKAEKDNLARGILMSTFIYALLFAIFIIRK